jgi:hypothetical protein
MLVPSRVRLAQRLVASSALTARALLPALSLVLHARTRALGTVRTPSVVHHAAPLTSRAPEERPARDPVCDRWSAPSANFLARSSCRVGMRAWAFVVCRVLKLATLATIHSQ